MQVDALSVVLRPRPMAEAADLGVRLVQAHARSVWRTLLPVWGGVLLLALTTVELSPWLPALLVFWLKPWLDRSLLFVLSRAVFGQATRFADLWQQARGVWLGQLLRTLTWRRLSPWRAFTQPVDQLEGLRGRARRQRRALLLRGRRGAAFGMQFVFANVEGALYFGALALLAWFAPEGSIKGMWDWLNAPQQATLVVVVSVMVQASMMLLVEPFFVAAGFLMYLNRRVELEAWDIEQEFRLAFAH